MTGSPASGSVLSVASIVEHQFVRSM